MDKEGRARDRITLDGHDSPIQQEFNNKIINIFTILSAIIVSMMLYIFAL